MPTVVEYTITVWGIQDDIEDDVWKVSGLTIDHNGFRRAKFDNRRDAEEAISLIMIVMRGTKYNIDIECRHVG